MTAARKRVNVLKLDPSRTITLRRAFAAKLRARLARLRRKVVHLIAAEDALGLKPVPHPLARNERWRFRTDSEKVDAFRQWLREQFADDLTGADEESLWLRYIQDGYRRGAGRAFDDARRSRSVLEGEAHAAGKEAFLRDSFGRGTTPEKVKLLAGRAFSDLKGVTAEMETRMTRSLADGLVRGASPAEVARDLAETVDGIGQSRALLIARTELVRAHAQGQLDALGELGVTHVGVEVEWLASADACPICSELSGKVMTLEEASGEIPAHPACRCCFVPRVPPELTPDAE